MQIRLRPLAALALAAVFAPGEAAAGAPPLPPALAAFDLRTAALPDADADQGIRGAVPAPMDEATLRQKVKLRWLYQPTESGPQFEVGTYGSRKGAMKSKLLHIAMDWRF